MREIKEGEFDIVPDGEDLLYPHLDSCLSITCTNADGNRCGGHAVMVPDPEAGQLTLAGICERLTAQGDGQRLYIIGAFAYWEDNAFLNPENPIIGLPRYQGGGAITSIQEIPVVLNYPNEVIYIDTTTQPCNVTFHAANRQLTVTDFHENQTIYNGNW